MDSKIVSRNFILLALVNLFAAMGFFMLIPVLPIFAMKVIRLPESEVGLVVGAFSISAIIFRPFMGYLIDNYRRETILLVALSVFCAALYSHILITSLSLLILIRMVQGGGWGSITTTTATMIVDVLPPSQRAKGIGYFTMAMPLAMVVGPAIGLEIFEGWNSFNIVFFCSGSCTLVALFSAFMINMPEREKSAKSFNFSLSGMYEKRALGIAFLQYCYSFIYSGIVTFIPIFALDNNISNVTYYFIVFAIFVILSRFFVSGIFDKYGPTPLMLAGLLSFCFGNFLLSSSTTTTQLIYVGAFIGIAGGILMPLFSTMTMNIVEPSVRGKANATIFTALDLGMGTGALFFGYLIEHISYRQTYHISALIMLVPFFYYIFIERKRYFAFLNKLQGAIKASL